MEAWTEENVLGLLQLLAGLWSFCWIAAGWCIMSRLFTRGNGFRK